MVGELLKHSDKKELLENVPEHLRDVHKVRKRAVAPDQGVLLPPSGMAGPSGAKSTSLWDDDDDFSAGTIGGFEIPDFDADNLDEID